MLGDQDHAVIVLRNTRIKNPMNWLKN